MELIQQCYHDLFWGALVLLGLGLLAVMVYIIRARLTVDRIIGINLTGTLVAIIIAILTYLLGEDYLADVAIVYVVLSFIAVMLLCRIYINLYRRRREEKEDDSHDR
jgi:multicomponent Na+:H+ antiporter subunit F